MADTILKTRERWLKQAAEGMQLWFKDQGYPLPAFRASFGFIGAGKRSRSGSECFDRSASADGVYEIFIKPDNAEPVVVAARLGHELCHISVGLAHLHTGPFEKMALFIGLERPLSEPIPGPIFRKNFGTILSAIGPLPHAPLDPQGLSSARIQQSGRHIKVFCPTCGYICRTSRTWLNEKGPPHCPDHGQMQIED